MTSAFSSAGASPVHVIDDDETSMDCDSNSRASLIDPDIHSAMVVPRYNHQLVFFVILLG